MNDTCTVFHRYVLVADCVVSLFLLLSSFISRTLIKSNIRSACKVSTLVGFKDLISLLAVFCKAAQNGIEQSSCHVICVAVACLYLGILIVGVKAQSNV